MQTRRQPPRKNIWETGVWFLLPAVFVGLAILCGMVLLFALLLLKADAPAWMETLLALAALLTAGYGMGRFAGYRRHRKGLRTGLQKQLDNLTNGRNYTILFQSGQDAISTYAPNLSMILAVLPILHSVRSVLCHPLSPDLYDQLRIPGFRRYERPHGHVDPPPPDAGGHQGDCRCHGHLENAGDDSPAEHRLFAGTANRLASMPTITSSWLSPTPQSVP